MLTSLISHTNLRYIFILYSNCGLVENGETRLQTPRILYTLLIGTLSAFTYCTYPLAAVWNDYIFFSTGITGRLCLGLMICHQINFKKVLLLNICSTCGPVVWCYLFRIKARQFLSKMVTKKAFYRLKSKFCDRMNETFVSQYQILAEQIKIQPSPVF